MLDSVRAPYLILVQGENVMVFHEQGIQTSVPVPESNPPTGLVRLPVITIP